MSKESVYRNLSSYGGFKLSESQIEKFHARIKKGLPNECWPWTGRVDKFKRGRLTYVIDKKRRWFFAPRVLAELIGMTPGKLQVCHSCDNPTCMNPGHLWLGTGKENCLDRDLKGRNKVRTHMHSEKWRAAMKENGRNQAKNEKWLTAVRNSSHHKSEKWLTAMRGRKGKKLKPHSPEHLEFIKNMPRDSNGKFMRKRGIEPPTSR